MQKLWKKKQCSSRCASTLLHDPRSASCYAVRVGVPDGACEVSTCAAAAAGVPHRAHQPASADVSRNRRRRSKGNVFRDKSSWRCPKRLKQFRTPHPKLARMPVRHHGETFHSCKLRTLNDESPFRAETLRTNSTTRRHK